MTSRRKTPWSNGPDPKTQEILNAALEHVQSVPYDVSLRWVFYRLYQDGYYSTKKGYNAFEYLCSRARHTGWGGWQPDTLADETREIIKRTYGYPNMEEALESLPTLLGRSVNLELNHFYQQNHYIELWYEARAMTGQFKHYTTAIDLVPLGGMSSIPYKWNMAKRLEDIKERYGIPIIILYFGDEDLAGHAIKADVEEDVFNWSDSEFEIKWCGLTEKQAEKYGVPHSVEKEGYQWEALADEAAKEIIEASVYEYVNREIIRVAKEETEEEEDRWSEIVQRAIEDAIEEEEK